ncbi:P27 family phage terminase small subunit [Caldinitratiruptor microaerophilus]|uniref:Uncharacterized protein n=1 Tax=Caldinitratiruptor microaerophilus TaxID=671077 RepID=A0AA35G9L8_9FIRM|nr:P27 family phage terminase small subunit [Caldinitratiruptor microaerophilus]BDG62330.1 hypothetical protein caldi_34200 [Caldinitratiruptor microaerophilus]
MKPQPPPEGLSGEAQQVWWRTLRFLRDLGTLDQVSAEELADYCWAVARMQEHREHDSFLQDSQVMLAFARKYGLTPASRARLGIVWTNKGWRRLRRRTQEPGGVGETDTEGEDASDGDEPDE